jgi:hypothetical protein
MKPIFKIGDKVTFYGIKGTITAIKQIDETTFEYTINNEYKTIQETDWDSRDWDIYIKDKPYHQTDNSNKLNTIQDKLNVMQNKLDTIQYRLYK